MEIPVKIIRIPRGQKVPVPIIGAMFDASGKLLETHSFLNGEKTIIFQDSDYKKSIQ